MTPFYLSIKLNSWRKSTGFKCEYGARLETYIIEGRKGSGEVIINGPAALKIKKGEVVIIIGYILIDVEDAKKYQPKIHLPK